MSNMTEIISLHVNRKKSIHFVLAFVSISIVAFTSALDATILAVALPVVATDLNMTSLQSFWAGISFLLSSVVFQPIHTAFSDIFGRKSVLYICILFFVVGSAIVGASKNAAALIAGRTIQGIGGGGMEALCEIILTDLTTLKERPLYLGILGLMWAGGSVLAPIVGGLFSEYSSWRWIAWINLPLMGIALLLIPQFLTLKQDHSSIRAKLKRVDWIGILLLMTGMTLFILALCWGGQLFKWKSWQTVVPLTSGLLILVALAFYEQIPTEPIFKYRIFASRTSSIAFFGSFIHGLIIWCLVYYLVLYFEGAIQHPPFHAAVDAFPLAFTLTPMAIVCALLIDYARRYYWAVLLGWALCTVGLGTMVILDNETSKGVYCAVQLAPGIGTGFLLSALAVPLQASMLVDDAGTAMGLQVFFRAVGALVGVSMGSAIFTNEFNSQLHSLDLPSDLVLPDASDAVHFLTSIKNLDISSEIKAQILKLYAEPIKQIWVAMACLAGVGLLSSLFMKELTLEREELGRQAFEQGSVIDKEALKEG